MKYSNTWIMICYQLGEPFSFSTDAETTSYMSEMSRKLFTRNLFLDMKVPEVIGALIVGRYLTSNVNITVNGISLPIGARYRKFRTPVNNYTILAFGVLFDFTGASSSFVF